MNCKRDHRSSFAGLTGRAPSALAAGLAFAVLLPAVSGQLILLDARGGFDSSHNLASGSGFTQFRNEITSAGFQYAPVSSFDSASLQGASAIFLLQPYSAAAAYSQTEISALTSFASNHGLVLLADGGTGSSADYLNALSSSFGVIFASTATEPLGATITQFNPHPLTAGVHSIGLDYQRRLTINSPASDLTPGSGPDDFAATSGRAIFVSDSSIFMDPDAFSDASIASGDNRRFAQNVILTVVPEPTPFIPAALLLASVALVRLRRGKPTIS